MAKQQGNLPQDNETTRKKIKQPQLHRKQPIPNENQRPDRSPGILDEERNVNHVTTHR
jgi:hypothetical protein